MTRLGLALLWVLVGVSLVGLFAPTPVRLSVTPRFGMSGGSLCVKVLVERHAENRILATGIECDRYSRLWQEQLDGDTAPYERRHCFEKMPAGHCAIGASVYRVDRSEKNGVATFSARDTACFAGMDVEC